jgi:hypothetical protein
MEKNKKKCHAFLGSWIAIGFTTLQIILNLCIPDKELAKTHSQSSFKYRVRTII